MKESIAFALAEKGVGHAIDGNSGRDDAAWLIMSAFTNGANSLDELWAALETEERRQA
ncbi:hypothetical protein [Mesorhizobium carmichaelinearum]|uniref:hypothetical protein n=1 Tax=Mesorhizobium carmichaelinearum TaxID=1208188 RepID=UPI0015CEEA3C|nr:hypothetical protein [Mesorhizobium carmichaelinearum]